LDTLARVSYYFLHEISCSYIPNPDKTLIEPWMDESSVATHDKNITEPHMDEFLVTLDLGHHITSRSTPPLSFRFPENHLLEDIWNKGFSQ
jgi:hypothetical protein